MILSRLNFFCQQLSLQRQLWLNRSSQIFTNHQSSPHSLWDPVIVKHPVQLAEPSSASSASSVGVWPVTLSKVKTYPVTFFPVRPSTRLAFKPSQWEARSNFIFSLPFCHLIPLKGCFSLERLCKLGSASAYPSHFLSVTETRWKSKVPLWPGMFRASLFDTDVSCPLMCFHYFSSFK